MGKISLKPKETGGLSKKVVSMILSSSFLLGVSAGYTSHDHIQRVVDFINFTRAEPAEDFFPDYNHVEIIHRRDAKSQVQTFVYHPSSESYVPVTEDFFKKYQAESGSIEQLVEPDKENKTK